MNAEKTAPHNQGAEVGTEHKIEMNVVVPDISSLNDVDRLGVAACRLNCWEWDDILGPKPEGFDSLPEYTPKRHFWERKKVSKHDFVYPARNAIKNIIGEANISRCWWKYILGKSDEEWFRWYISEHIRSYRISNRTPNR